MADTESKALKAKDKMEITTPTEQMKPGLVFTPAVDIFALLSRRPHAMNTFAIVASRPGRSPASMCMRVVFRIGSGSKLTRVSTSKCLWIRGTVQSTLKSAPGCISLS